MIGYLGKAFTGLGKAFTGLGKGILGAGKLGLKALHPLFGIDIATSGFRDVLGKYTNFDKNIFNSGFGGSFMNNRYTFQNAFKNLTKMSAELNKTAQRRRYYRNARAGGVGRAAQQAANASRQQLSRLERLTRGARNVANLLNDVDRSIQSGIHLYDYGRIGADRLGALISLLKPQPQPPVGKYLMYGLLGAGGLLGGYNLWKKKQEEERKRILGNELYNRYLYYRMYPLQKTSGILDTIGKYVGTAATALKEYAVENPLKSLALGAGAALAGKELYDIATMKQDFAYPNEDQLFQVVEMLQQADPYLQTVSKADIYSALKSIAMYNPLIVRDPGAVASIVKQVISYGGVSPDLIALLTKSYKDYVGATATLKKMQPGVVGSAIKSVGSMLF